MKKALKPSMEMSDGAVLTLGNTVIAALTGNAFVPSPQPGLLQLQAAVDAYSASLPQAKYGGRQERAQKDADKEALVNLLREECDYVNLLANGDAVIISTCGFPLSKDRAPIALGTPQAKVVHGASGMLILSTPAVAGAVAYKHQYTADSNSGVWQDVSSTRAVCTIEGLTPGTVYSLRIVAIGRKDQVTFSDVVTKMAA